jgi:uncharacterized protein
MRAPRPVVVFDRSMREYDVDGRLHVDNCNISKACINPYRGNEIPDYVALGLNPNRVYQMYRDPTELERAAETFNGIQLMIVHKAVNAQRPEQRLVVGTVHNARFRAPYLVADLAIWTREAVSAVESRQQEQLSCGYRYRADMSPGVLQGEAYDGIMRDIIANHLALVEEGRVGPDAIVPDHKPRSLKKMRNAILIAAMAPFLAMDADLEALDADLEKAKEKEAKDAMPEGMDKKAWDEMSPEEKDECRAKDKKAKDKKAKDEAEKAAKDKKAKDDAFTPSTVVVQTDPEGTNKDKAMDAKLKGMVTIDQMNTAIAASTKAAVAAVGALSTAREEVKPFTGAAGMAFDNADDVYKHALTHLKIDIEGVHPSAYRTILNEVRKVRTAKSATGITQDSKNRANAPSLSSLFPVEASPTIN